MNYILNEIMGGGASSIKAVKRQSPFYEMVWVTHIGWRSTSLVLRGLNSSNSYSYEIALGALSHWAPVTKLSL